MRINLNLDKAEYSITSKTTSTSMKNTMPSLKDNEDLFIEYFIHDLKVMCESEKAFKQYKLMQCKP